jgi:hypothetical protein
VRVREWRYDGDRRHALAQGDEMGRFLLGSTVVLLFPAGPLAFNPAWRPGGAIRMGEAMAGYPMTGRERQPPAGLRCCCGWCRRCGPRTT